MCVGPLLLYPQFVSCIPECSFWWANKRILGDCKRTKKGWGNYSKGLWAFQKLQWGAESSQPSRRMTVPVYWTSGFVATETRQLTLDKPRSNEQPARINKAGSCLRHCFNSVLSEVLWVYLLFNKLGTSGYAEDSKCHSRLKACVSRLFYFFFFFLQNTVLGEKRSEKLHVETWNLDLVTLCNLWFSHWPLESLHCFL